MSRYRSQIREVINCNVVVSLALEQGFNAFLPVYDGGIDFILYREDNGTFRKVHLRVACSTCSAATYLHRQNERPKKG